MAVALPPIRRLITAATQSPKPNLILTRLLSSASSDPYPPKPHRTQTRFRTPKVEKWTEYLKPGFTPTDVNNALTSVSDPDLALEIFRWTGQRRGYTHTAETYHTILKTLFQTRRTHQAEPLVHEILAGACLPSRPLFNSVIRFCCHHQNLFPKALDVYKKMFNSATSSPSLSKLPDPDFKPDLETYTTLFAALLQQINRPTTGYMYLKSVLSLYRQMKSLSVFPDSYVLNMVVAACSKCGDVKEAIRVFREMGLYRCEPNEQTYSYIARALCENNNVARGFGYYKEMREKGMIPDVKAFMILICALAMDGRVVEAVETVEDMLGCSMSPDYLTYKTVLEEMCRAKMWDKAVKSLEVFRKKDRWMSVKTYNDLREGLRSANRR